MLNSFTKKILFWCKTYWSLSSGFYNCVSHDVSSRIKKTENIMGYDAKVGGGGGPTTKKIMPPGKT